MVTGLDRFVAHFRGFEDAYILIGGAACDLWLGTQELPFRATKDLDLVLVVEALTPAFHQRFWAFIADGNYASLEQSASRPQFYRFREPRSTGYPFMIELLTRNFLELPPGTHLTPIPAEEDVSSLSAILLEEDYYRHVVASRITVSGVPIVPARCLIPLKARAWLDLTGRRQRGDRTVRSDDIRKHRNDVFRLLLALVPTERFVLPPALQHDLQRFLDSFPPAAADWPAIRNAVGPGLPASATAVARLRAIFQLAPAGGESSTPP
ncbi:MAG: hypothetical protein A3K19_30170 [Lentisphaerae bacterium RIFOXYB12_FULL_65_16]|nr:MAG: hypothetical protein A3K18_29535 [Lentisphaerae bacterium RIFOXYA12_64_32]OGV85840.1 MAG: hypothetical protein A3K19_30170 [Lentisphaerae bacterium RIFOXYB12_FULL_65_16]